MNDLPIVQIIITAYERLEYFKLCFESAYNQSYELIEVVVLDNSITNDISDFLSFYGDNVVYVKNSMNIRSLGNMTKGFRWVDKKYFYMLSSDVILHERAIEKMVDFLEANNHIPAVFANSYNYYNEEDVRLNESYYVSKKLVKNESGSYETKPIIKDFFYNYPRIQFSIWECLINTEFFVYNHLKDLRWGSNAEEYRESIEFMLKTEMIGYLNEGLKYNIVHDNKSSYRNYRYKLYEKITIYDDLIASNQKQLLVLGVNIPAVKARLFVRHLWNSVYPDLYGVMSAIYIGKSIVMFVPVVIVTPVLQVLSIFRLGANRLIGLLRECK